MINAIIPPKISKKVVHVSITIIKDSRKFSVFLPLSFVESLRFTSLVTDILQNIQTQYKINNAWESRTTRQYDPPAGIL